MRKQLLDLRNKMKEHHIDAYIIPTTDFHESEYVNDYFKCREFVSGFTGSAGTLVVTMDEAKLWTDGRYFLQAAAQLSRSGIDLMKTGQPGVPSIIEYLENTLTDDDILGFDGRVCSAGKSLAKKFNVSTDHDLVDEIWEDRPKIIPTEIYPLYESVTGESSASKIARVRDYMSKNGADYHLTASLEEIAWLYNLRGSDVEHTPVFFSYALITADSDYLYIMDETFTKKAGGTLSSSSGYAHGNKILPYDRFLYDIKKLPAGTMILNESITNYAIIKALPSDIKIISSENPVSLFKAIKNSVEIGSTKKAHLKDGAAMVNFLYWLKTNIGKIKITEISASDYLDYCRRQHGAFDLSFDTISGYADNGAIIHYCASEETNKTLEPEGLYLVDSGGQYPEGTTDITRTVALGPVTDEMKTHYTAVLKGHIALSTAHFKPGTNGSDLDAIARKPLIDAGLNYNHGTGHGVGHLLGCHEGPQTISPRGKTFAIEPGMINSNEPGVYIEGSHGIRLENEILCVELPPCESSSAAADTSEHSDNPENSLLYGFEPITFCPFDRDAIIVDDLTDDELSWLNNYHRHVWDKISPLVEAPVREWLEEETKALVR